MAQKELTSYIPKNIADPRTETALFLRLSNKLPGGGFKLSAHSFRKYHNTQLEAAGMNTNWIKNLQGKSHYEYSDPRGLTLTEK